MQMSVLNYLPHSICQFYVSDPEGTQAGKLQSRWAQAGSFGTCCQVCQTNKHKQHITIQEHLTPLKPDA